MKIRRSLLISFLNSNVNTAAMFVVALFLARWLTPSQIGAFSIGAVVINLASVFRDLGAQPYLVQKSDLRPSDAASALGLMIFNSWILAAGLWCIAPTLARYFGQPDISGIVRILTVSFLLVPLSGVMSAVLIRELRAEKNAIVTSASTAAFCVVSLTLAAKGYGAQTLAWANLANVAANVVGYWILRPKTISFRPTFKGWRPIITYGGGVVVNSLALVANQSMPDLVIGRMIGSHALGVYSRANGLVSLFQQAIQPTLNYNIMPYVAHSGDDRATVAIQLSKASAYLSGTAWPVYAFLAVYAESVLNVLYGEQWLEAAPLVAVLCVAGVLRSPYLHFTGALQAVERTWAAALPSIAALVVRLLAILLLRPGSLLTLAACLCLGDIVFVFVTALLAEKHLGVMRRVMLNGQLRSACVGSGCLLVSWLLHIQTIHMPAIGQVLVALPVVSFSWLVLVVVSKHPISNELSAVGQRMKWAKTTSANK